MFSRVKFSFSLVHEDALLDGVGLLVGYPDEVVGRLLELVSNEEAGGSSGHVLHELLEGGLLVEDGVGDDPVPFCLLEGGYDPLGVVVEEGQCRRRGLRRYLDYSLRACPYVGAVDDALVDNVGVDYEEDDVTVYLEYVCESRGGDVHEVVHRLYLHEIGGVGGKEVTGGRSEVSLPVVLVHHHQDLSRLAGDVGKEGLPGVAGGKKEDCCEQGNSAC